MGDLLLLFSGLRTKKWVSIVSLSLLLFYMVVTTDWSYGIWFPIVNILTMVGIAVLIHLTKGIPNATLSVISKFIYSVIIDIICYFWFPMFTNGMTLIQYIWSGIVFNWKSLLIDTSVFLVIVVVKVIMEKKSESKTFSTR